MYGMFVHVPQTLSSMSSTAHVLTACDCARYKTKAYFERLQVRLYVYACVRVKKTILCALDMRISECLFTLNANRPRCWQRLFTPTQPTVKLQKMLNCSQ